MKRGFDPHKLPSAYAGGSLTPASTLYGPSPPGHATWPQTFQPPPPIAQSLSPPASQIPGPALFFARHQSAYPVPSYYDARHVPPGLAAPHGYHRILQNPESGDPSSHGPPETAPRAPESAPLPQISFFSTPRDRPLPPTLQAVGTARHNLDLGPGAATEPPSMPQNGLVSSAPGADRLRVRVNKACERCRLHKIKCSGRYPCLNCQKHDLACRYRALIPVESAPKAEDEVSSVETQASDPQDAAGTSHSATPPELNGPARRMHTAGDKHAASASQSNKRAHCDGPSAHASDAAYVRYLENKVRHLEAVVSKGAFHGPCADSMGLPYKLDDIVVIQRATSSKWRLCRRYQGALAIELCSSLYNGLSPEAQAQVHIPRTNYFGFNMSGCHYLRPDVLPPFPDPKELSSEHREVLIDFFFKEINPLYAIVHESVFREQYKAFRDVLPEERPANNVALFAAMLSLILALGIRFMEFMKPAGPARAQLLVEETLYKYAHLVLLIFSAEWESFELIQCWLLSTLYLRISHRQTSCHLSFGNALNMCRSMGLGKYDQILHDSSAYEVAKAKRIFYAVYSFDRIIGLQGGRISGMCEDEIKRMFPLLDFEKESANDDWITAPAFAMLHIARLAHYLNLAYSNEHDLITAEKMTREFDEVREWLDNNGFHDEQDIFTPDAQRAGVSSLVKAQVKLHFYELIQCIHAKMLFGFFGHRVSIEGMKISTVLQCNKDIIYLLHKVLDSGGLYAPWYLTLQLILTVGINSLVFVNGGIHVAESRRLIKDTMAILQVIRDSPVYNENGELVFKLRFRMVEECRWLFKMMNHIMSLHYQESLKGLRELGTDHGSSAVNLISMKFENPPRDSIDNVLQPETEQARNAAVQENGWNSKDVLEETPQLHQEQITPGGEVDFTVEEYLENLAWFDRWLDFSCGP